MPACARREIVRQGEPGIYHCWSRTVRQTNLCGKDQTTGKDYSVRRDWIRAFQERLAGLFAVEIAFRAEMSNHFHLILRTLPEVARQWSDEEVARRWLTISRLIRSPDGQAIRPVTDEEIAVELAKPSRAEVLRLRLSDISQFMKALCEHTSRRANREDGTKGAFFEGRFRSREILDEPSLLVCAMYVDLNPIRAGETITPEASTHTSVHDRIVAHQQRQGQKPRKRRRKKQLRIAAAQVQAADGWMSKLELDQRSEAYQRVTPSADGRRASDKGLLGMTFEQYLKLLDWSGRQLKQGKTGSIPRHLAPILERLQINSSMWLKLVSEFDQLFTHVVGRSQAVLDRAAEAGRRWYQGQVNCRAAFG